MYRLSPVRLLFVLFLLAGSGSSLADWRTDLDILLDNEDPNRSEALLDKVLDAGPDCEELAKAIREHPFPEPAFRGDAHLDSILCIDGVVRPFVTYLPLNYDPKTPTPLFIWLHGGVGSEKIYGDPVGYAREDMMRKWAEREGWLMLFPFGQAEAVWWDEVGMANIDAQLRLLKRRYNIDDNRVFLGGFSDGASAAWFFAMAKPDDYAAFIALNGHMGVASLSGDQPTYAPNLANTPVLAVHTDNDGLYPSRKMAPTVAMALKAGGDITYHVVEGYGHDLDYAAEHFPGLVKWLGDRKRDRFPRSIHWESGKTEFGSCRWISIDRVLPEAPADWHRDWNYPLTSERISIGFFHDDQFEGRGVRVARLSDGDTAARRIGLEAEDIIVGSGDLSIDNMENLGNWKRTLSRGDEISLSILRGETLQTLRGKLPEAELYNLFKREVPSASIRVSRKGNRIKVSGSRLGGFTVRVHPELFNLDRPISVRAAGRLLFHKQIEADPEYMLRNFLRDRDRELLYVGEISIDPGP
jgi:predicted esterase